MDIAEPLMTYLERIEPKRNMARFYLVTIDTDLFGVACLTRRWGRIGSWGRERKCTFATLASARAAGNELVLRKRRRNYLEPFDKLSTF